MTTEPLEPSVAGRFYPAAPGELLATVERLLAGARPPPTLPPGTLRGVIAPHAGYVYSGEVAASAYALVAGEAERVRRVVLLGPAHRMPIHGLALPGAPALTSPLGPVPLDPAGVAEAAATGGVETLRAAHVGEHCLEVHLPFLQAVLGEFTLVPLVVGTPAPETVARVLRPLWAPGTLVVVSSDLSHFLRDRDARAADEATARALEALDQGAIRRDDACGRIPLRGVLLVARERGMRVTRLDLRNSADAGGSRSRVVGYGAWALHD